MKERNIDRKEERKKINMTKKTKGIKPCAVILSCDIVDSGPVKADIEI